MSNEESKDDRLTKNEFAELIQHLSVQEILAIEYRIGNAWAKLFSRKNEFISIFSCNLCVVETSSFKNLLDHVGGRKHIQQMERVKQLYHPDYTYPKNDKKESTETSHSKSSADPAANSSSTNAAPIVSICNDRKEKADELTNKNRVCDKILLAQNKKDNLRNSNIEGKPTVCNNQSKLHDSLKMSVDVNNEIYKKQEKDNVNPAAEISSVCNGINKDNNIGGIKSGKEFVLEKSHTCMKDSEKNNNQSAVEKRALNSDSKIEKEPKLKKPKLVINPAAALSLSKNSLNSKECKILEEEKPQYQTNKIIIPTVHKNKAYNDKDSQSALQSQPSDLPKFSVNSYSFKSNDIDVHGILGVEYVIKILKNRNDISPRYECGLCELVLDGFAMQRHLEGYDHRLKFCEKHFPTAIRHYRQYMQNVPEHELFKVMAPVLAKLAVAIEEHHGRNLPYECYERDFSLNRHEILAKAFSCRHASEQYGPTFTHVVGAKEIDEYISGRQNYLPPAALRTAIFDKPGINGKGSGLCYQYGRSTDKESLSRDRNHRHRHDGRESSTSNDISKLKDRSCKSYMSSGLYDDLYKTANFYEKSKNMYVSQNVDDETYNLMVDDFLKGTLKGLSDSGRKRSASPFNTMNPGNRKSLSPLRKNDIWQAYRHMVDRELNNLDEIFKQYRKDPEAHPSYNEEWQKFWKRRKDELISAGLDHRNYNYQPEWVKFIKVRIEELYNQEIENVKIKSRERLCLPMTNNNLLDIKYHVKIPKIATLNESRTASLSAEIRSMDNLAKDLPSVTSSNEGVSKVVSVLRLMTALEDNLGSLGPKIIDLLSKALQAEKANPAQVNAIILTNENCSLIETANEKLKGLVITGLFEGSKEKVLKQVINDADVLLKYAFQNRQLLSSQRYSNEPTMRRTQNSTSLAQKLSSEGSMQLLDKSHASSLPLTENLLTRIDKKELASKLAASLVAQGKTDFEPQQLQQLIAVYTLIERRKRGSGIISFNKEAETLNKRKLSDTLSDLLKPSSSTSSQNNVSVSPQSLDNRNLNNTAQKNTLGNSNVVNSTLETSFNSVLQNSRDNYFINSKQPQLTNNSYGINVTRGNQFEQQIDHSANHKNSNIPHQQYSLMKNRYNNDQYQNNNRIDQNWRSNSNMEMNSNYNMGRSNNYNQSTNWRTF